MRKSTWMVLALACAGATTASAQTTEDRMAQLEARVQSLESELKQYRAQPDAATVDKVLADALARSSNPLGGGKAGYSNGYFIADQQNNFQLKLNGMLQSRYIWNHNDSTADDRNETGFQVRRAELYLNGNAFNNKVFFQYGGGFDRATGNFTIVSAYAGYQFSKEAEIRAGIFKPPFMVEELTSAGRQQAVERSLVNSIFTTGTSEGVQVQYSKGDVRVAAMVHDGTNVADSDFNADKTDWAVAARGEWKLAGEWSQFADFSGWDDSKFAARLGAGVDYESGETGDAATNTNMLKYTADLTLKGRGWNLFFAGVAKHTEDNGAADGNLDQYGMVAQAGKFIVPNRVEVFGRYEYIYLDGMYSSTVAARDNSLNLATVGVNWFLLGHNVKIVTDVMYVFDELPASNTGLGLLASDDGAQLVVRTGLFLLF